MIKSKFGDRLDGWIQAAFPFLFRRAIDPNLLTVAGTAISAGAGVALAAGAFVWGGVLILAGGLFDLVDGVVARHHGRATAFGAFLDSTLDRLVDMAVLIGIMTWYASRADAGTVALAGVALAASVLTSYAKARAERYVPSLEGGMLERGERLVILALGAMTGLMVPALWVVAVLGSITAVQRMVAAHRALSKLDAASGATPRERS